MSLDEPSSFPNPSKSVTANDAAKSGIRRKLDEATRALPEIGVVKTNKISSQHGSCHPWHGHFVTTAVGATAAKCATAAAAAGPDLATGTATTTTTE